MSEHGPRVQFHGIPESERPDRDQNRERENKRSSEDVERRAFALPDAYIQVAERAMASVARIAQKHGLFAELPTLNRVLVMPDPHFDSLKRDKRQTIAADYSARTGIVTVRLSELLPAASKEEMAKVYGVLQRAVMDSYVRMMTDEFDALKAASFETRSASALMALFTVDELSRLFFDKDVSIRKVRSLLNERFSERIADPQVLDLVRRTLSELFVPNEELGRFPYIQNAPNKEERVKRQVWLEGRSAYGTAGNRLLRHVFEIATAERKDAVERTVTHEMAHALAWNAVSEFPDGTDTRSGYRMPARSGGDYFRSLNEACTETIAQKAVVGEEDGAYKNDRLLLRAIVRGIASAKGENEAGVWKRFERGYFTGESFHLRDIESTFGREAWDWYKILSPKALRKPSAATRKKLERYFSLRLAP